MKMLLAFRYLLIAIIGTLLLSSCDPSLLDYDGDTGNSRKLVIKLKDNPVEAEEVNVDIQGIIIKTDDGFDEVELETAAGVYNLLDYQDGADTLIGNVIIDFENIKEIRLILGENNSIKINGELFPLKVPSGSQSGLKIKVNIDVTNDELVEILIDFDAGKSVVDLGNGNYILKPVINVESIIADGEVVAQGFLGNVDCVRGKGYWKTHSENGPAALDSTWLELPDSSRTELFTTEKTYLSFLEGSAGNDLYKKLAQQYIIAELNVIAGVEIGDDVHDSWNKAGLILEKYAETQEVETEEDKIASAELKEVLSMFNDGELSPESCDEDEDEDENDDEDEDENDVEDENGDEDDEEDEEDDEGVTCTRGKGYWKTHSDQGPAGLNEAWLELENGASTAFFTTGKTYLYFLQASGGNNIYVKLAQQYIIAELNVLAGVEMPSNSKQVWDEAATLLEQYADNQVIGSSDEGNAKDLESSLKKFNNGSAGPVSCDDDEDDEEDENDDEDDEDEDDEYENLTEAMIAIIKQFYSGAEASNPKSITLCDGSSALELKINFNSSQIFLIFNQGGDTYLAKYVKSDKDALNASINSTLESNYDGYKVKKVYKWTSSSEVITYEVEIQKQSDKKLIIFNENGDVTCG